jgi:palmitoyltransferase
MEPSQLAVPAVYVLIFFLGYPSQYLLLHLEPAPLTKNEIVASNVILVLILITYTKSVFVDPGTIPKDWNTGVVVKVDTKGDEKELQGNSGEEALGKTRKWCFRCEAAKPPRAHHCKECKR